MKKQYVNPEMELVRFEDVITSSSEIDKESIETDSKSFQTADFQ